MTPSSRNFLLTIHLVASVGWIGALAVFLAHAIVSVTSVDAHIVAAACLGMGVAAWFVILPMAVATVITGIVQALMTAWGLLRHYWIIFKLLLTALATGVLLLKLGPIDDLARSAASTAFAMKDSAGLRVSLLIHAIGGLLVLGMAAGLAVYKPAGITPRGVRAKGSGDATAPLWVRRASIAAGIAGLILLVMAIAGNHGPGAHLH